MAKFGKLTSALCAFAFVGSVVAGPTAMAQADEEIADLQSEFEGRLESVAYSEEAEAVVRYPFELAAGIASGDLREEARPFADRLARSREVLSALEEGKGIVRRGVGDQDRVYRFEETGRLIPYRLYVPTAWDGEEALPLVVILHGGGGDENEMFELDDGKLAKLAERYNYIVVSPLGYDPVGAYGSPIRLPSVYGSETERGQAVGGPERATLLKRSERDVLNVLEMTAQEYGVDRSRIFLTGHSMGSGGTWYLAHQYPHLWRAIAPSAGPFFIDDYDFERLRGLGIMIVQGSGDPLSLAANRQLASDLLDRGFGVNYVETPAVDHGETFGASLPTIFEFFHRQRLADDPTRVLELE
ncbi:PHB depolymerase family esterase [Aurantiacibacter flavus]|uniref:PHB depolymerase family esterase n=1 Tax=Aurantiacibacter flavus TaxID=3145232 RepID=A0ABV0CRT9_9SPHN